MGKRSHSELRSSNVLLSLHKYNLEGLKVSAKQHWNVSNIQPYFPPVEKLFKTTDVEDISEYGIRFNDEASAVTDSSTIKTASGSLIEIHKKVTMILSPYQWMRGSYAPIGLPSSSEQSRELFDKLQCSNNASYVGSIISAALSQTGCLHFATVYGIFNGVSDEHKLNISDDYSELCDRPWFSQNIGKFFDVHLSDEVQSSSEFKHTRTARVSIRLGEDAQLDNVETLDVPPADVRMGDLHQVLQDEEEDDAESDSSSVSTSYIFDIQSCDCEDEDDESYEGCEENFAWATFKNVPVQLTLMEKCTGTFYELIVQNPETEKHLAWVSQIMFALAYAQRIMGLTHNDLHANNVMYVKTQEEYFYYNCGGLLYRVPTFGYLIKIIDFERSIASIKITGMKSPKLFMSDQYHVDEEAGGQYNYGDYYLPKYPEIKPNPSFDLVRFATSIFWDLFPEGPESTEYSENLLFKLFMKWLTLEDGKSIMFSKLENRHDRYHGFHLYKAIARYCKDAVPRKEVTALKEIYGTESIPNGASVLLIEA